jgi:hypothetical protein
MRMQKIGDAIGRNGVDDGAVGYIAHGLVLAIFA